MGDDTPLEFNRWLEMIMSEMSGLGFFEVMSDNASLLKISGVKISLG